jgi:hypothetical protein
MAGVAAAAYVVLTATPASAHLAIRLDIRDPGDGAKVGRHTSLVIFAQPTLAGVDHTTFSVMVDTRPIDPDTGKPVDHDKQGTIAVSTTRRIPLMLTAGRHHVTVEYRPDIDEPPRQVSVDVEVHPSKPARWANALIAAAVMVLVATVVAVRRVRRAHP